MTTNLERYKKDIEALVQLGFDMNLDIKARNSPSELSELSEDDKAYLANIKGSFEKNYQKWYSEASALIRQLMPERSSEFSELYKGDGKRKDRDSQTYNIQDWLLGVRSPTNLGRKAYDDIGIAMMRQSAQVQILESVNARFESSLFDIKQLIQADLLDSEIEVARELHKAGFLRAAGAVAGVAVEKHLAQVILNHSVILKKAHPTISDLNDALKSAAVYDTPLWRNIQRLGDLRNLCDHNKSREPTKDEVLELIDGTDKLTKTLF